MKKYFVIVEWKGIVNASNKERAWELGCIKAERHGKILVEETNK